MKQVAAIITVSMAALSTTTNAFQTSITSTRPSHEAFALSATPSSQAGWGHSRGVPSKTARESACNVEWEPMSELERRIEDGIHYEHIPNHYSQNHGNPYSRTASKDGVPYSQGVFVGYRMTEEEYGRLKSADPTIQD
mmetsp:Transcript_19663/g.48341  ORF Transcript_19663/g.48341 Transcript_19663/m.48341 type:complete len:138 (+) Transcript_19663:141-554(+)|eukprot:CAMPEP_0113630794 /NCGR_PEP_ID=MMETSP0017_2-20120614/16001_1 /TAXON_ID=2856 /ORGANISM="Cylindrotheca closterium" /LENGTH=137 /DNA_ID=CAMNT_0000541275 /DNA_START=96 /DNA_END=509 /DNA_ORIENTATION=+ /assembly_acc=CAM_ASM_000147